MRRLFRIVFTAMLLVLCSATFVEQSHGTAFASRHVYHSLWFAGLWALLAAVSAVIIVRRRLWKRRAVALLHLSLLVILAGAATTFFTSQGGMLHIREGCAEGSFTDEHNKSAALPFTIGLDSFRIRCYPGTNTPSDYLSFVTIEKGEMRRKATISMNNILAADGYRIYQSSYDGDMKGTVLSVKYDPAGTCITYTGYLLLAVSMIWVLCSKKEHFRQLLRKVMSCKAAMLCSLLIYGGTIHARSLPTISKEKAESMARSQIVYNGRIVPLNTMARDFMLKIYGKPTYHGLTAEQVVCGWAARPDVWKHEPMIKVKDSSLRKKLGAADKHISLQSLFCADGSYKVAALADGGALSKPVQELDEKVGIIIMLTQGTLFSPLPSDATPLGSTRVEAEIIYNRLPVAKSLFMLNITLGMISLVFFILGMSAHKCIATPLQALFCLSLLSLLFIYALRWYISDHIPLGNGYETMLFMSVVIMTVSCIIGRRLPLVRSMGLLLSGFTLLVAHIGDSNPQITHLMPVLNSPLLSIHVSVIMMAYALLGMTFIIAVTYFVLAYVNKKAKPSTATSIARQLDLLTSLSQLLLYPAVFFLAGGIFIGAVWANISWGTYWSWDPKETWALITMLIYAMPFHTSLTGKLLHSPTRLHVFMLLAFLSLLMTYFGVNFFLGGMHSYA